MAVFELKNHNLTIPCHYGEKVLSELKEYTAGRRCFLLCDAKVYRSVKLRLLGIRVEGKYLLDPVEERKSFSTVEAVLERMAGCGLDRDSLLICMGGGTISDLGGFVAAVYLQGIDYVNVCTTPVAACDAAIGGRTGVHLTNAKNWVGLQRHPKAIFCDYQTLKTLAPQDVMSGVGVVYKTALLNAELHELTENHYERLLRLETPMLEQTLPLCAQIKWAYCGAKGEDGEGVLLKTRAGCVLGDAIFCSEEYGLRYGESVLFGLYFESLIFERATGSEYPHLSNMRENVLNFLRYTPSLRVESRVYELVCSSLACAHGQIQLMIPMEDFSVKSFSLSKREFRRQLETLALEDKD